MIDPRRLRVLQAVATGGSVAAAAQALHLTPPAVSQQLRALERETGSSLIDRSARQVTLTAAGRLLAGHGERIAAQLRQAERDLAELTGRVAGPVRLAAFQSVMRPLVAPALRELASTHPAIHPSVAERYGPGAVADLRRGDLDIVLTEYDADQARPHEPGLGLRTLAFDPYLVIVPQDWAITVHSPHDLAGRPWVAGPPGTACDHALQRLAAQTGITVAADDVCVEFPSVIALVAAGRGAAIIPQLSLADAPVTVCSLPEIGGRHIAALHRADTAHPSPATTAVLNALAEAGQPQGEHRDHDRHAGIRRAGGATDDRKRLSRRDGSMVLPATQLTVELIPHCASVTRDGWAGSHDVRPLAELGMRQAEALAAVIGSDVDGIYSSPAVRCRQTVGPLAAAAGLPVHDLAELYEAGDFGEPAAGTDQVPELMARALGGAWAAGRMLRAVKLMMDAHPRGRAAAASHGDVIPVLLATLSSAFAIPRPRHVGRGGWYTLRFACGGLTITPNDPVPE